MKYFFTSFMIGASFLFFSTSSLAQLSIIQTSTNYTIDFDNTVSNVNEGTYNGDGFTPSPNTGQLNSNAWAANGMSDGDIDFGGNGTSGDFARGTSAGDVTIGGFYAFEVSTGNYAFGIQPADEDWTPGDIILKLQNNTGNIITSIDLSYTIQVYNDQPRSNSFKFSHSSDNSAYTDVSSLDYYSTAVQDPSPEWESIARNITLSSLSIANVSYYYLRWTGADNSGALKRDEFALDDIVINAYTGIISEPTVQTEDPTNITNSTADLSGDVISANGAAVTDRGVCYRASSGVTISDNKTSATTAGSGAFSVNVSLLDAEDEYFYKAYATNSEGTSLADNEVSFWTLSTEPGGHPASFSATASGSTQINLAFSAASSLSNTDGYIILRQQDSDPAITGIEDGLAPGDFELPEGTVLVTTITSNSQLVYNDADLLGATAYHYLIVAYNWNESEDSTYNYLISGSPKTDNATTDTEANPPTDHVGSFAALTLNSSSIKLTWTDDAGIIASHAVLIKVNTTNIFVAPSDGTLAADDINLTDDIGNIVVARGSQLYTWEGMKPNQQYYFKIYPFTNNGSATLFKTDGSVPTANETTDVLANNNLFISEVTDASDNGRAKFVELYNGGTTTITFSDDVWYLSRQANASSWGDIKLKGSIAAGETMIISQRIADFHTAFGINSNQADFGISGNGNDGYFLYFGAGNQNGHIYDSYGVVDQDGTGEDWEYTNGKAVRIASINSPNTIWTSSEWEISMPAKIDDMTPGSYKETYTWAGTQSTSWNTKGANWYDATHNPQGYIPDAGAWVVIPNVTNDPVISSEAVCYELTINSGGVLTINSNKSLTVEGAITNSGGTNGLVIDQVQAR